MYNFSAPNLQCSLSRQQIGLKPHSSFDYIYYLLNVKEQLQLSSTPQLSSRPCRIIEHKRTEKYTQIVTLQLKEFHPIANNLSIDERKLLSQSGAIIHGLQKHYP